MLLFMSNTFLDFIHSPEALYSCRVVERVSWGEEDVVLRVAHCEVSAVLLLQPWVHALLSGGGGEVEGDGEEEEEVEEVDGHHQQELPLGPHCFTATTQSPLQRSSLITFHISQMVLHRWVCLNGKQGAGEVRQWIFMFCSSRRLRQQATSTPRLR